MSSDLHTRAKALLVEAQELGPEECRQFLAQRCGDDVELRRETERLLALAEVTPESFLAPMDREESSMIQGAVEVGATLGRYRIVGSLGRGGMGEVYRATDPDLARDIAIKILPPDLSRNPERLTRFKREAQALAALNHPGIVTIHSIEETDGLHFLTMELVEGTRLDEVVPEHGLPVDRFLALARPLTAALCAAHDAGITHRDLKPANILVSGEHEVRVLDFGLAHTQTETAGPSDLTMTGQILGTPSYMAPEQALGQPIDHRTDIFALGVLLYQMATGRRPFAGETLVELASAIVKSSPISVSALRPDLPKELAAVIERCLEKRPEERFQSASEILNQLAGVPVGRGTEESATASSTDTGEPDTAAPRRLRGLWIAGLAAVVVIAVGAYWRSRVADETESSTVSADPISEPAAAQSRKMIVVLPFESLSQDPDHESFADGMTEEMIAVLGATDPKGLGVIARTSAMQYKGRNIAVKQVGLELGTDYAVEGTVRRQGDRLRITAKLIDTDDQTQLWSEIFEGTLDDIFGLQSDVASQIAEQLSVELLPQQVSRRQAYSPKPEAYDAYLSGRSWTHQPTLEGWRKAAEFYERAVAIDPAFALAHSGLSDAASNQAIWGSEPRSAIRETARSAASEALRLEPELAEAHAAQALVHLFFERDWKSAEAEFLRALELNPSDGASAHHYGHLLDFLDRDEEAIEACSTAVRLDPLSSFHHNCLGFSYINSGQFGLADAALARALTLAPDLPLVHYTLGQLRERQGRVGEAVDSWEQAAKLSERKVRFMLGALGYGYGVAGRPDRARDVIQEIESKWPNLDITALDRAKVFAGLGENDVAFELLDQAYETGEPWIIGLKVDPIYPLFDDPRFGELMDRLLAPLTGRETI